MASKRRNGTARPSLLESIEVGTLEAYVPPALLKEMDEHIHRIAIKEKLDQQVMLSVWAGYQARLRVLEPDERKLETSRTGVDPDDAPFIALAETVGAVAIVSNDRHIRMMGGVQVSVEFVLP